MSAIALVSASAYCNESQEREEPLLDRVADSFVLFNPPVLSSDEDSPSCAGILQPDSRIALTSECTTLVKRYRAGHELEVVDEQGNPLGRLPRIESNDNPLLSLSQLFEPANTVTYEPLAGTLPDGEPDDFPVLLSAAELDQQGEWANVARLLIPDTGWEEVELEKLHSEPLQWAVSVPGARGNSGMLDAMQVPTGSPVVNEQGEVLCLLVEGGICENVAAKVLAGDDGSCHIPYFQQGCGNVTWEQCKDGEGKGECTKSNHEVCLVEVLPDMLDFPGKFHCRNIDGCGTIACPSECENTPSSCDCKALWGFCEIEAKTLVEPAACITQQGGSGGVDPRCNTQQPTTGPTNAPNDFRHSPAFLGVVIGVSVGTTVIGAVAIAVLVIVFKTRARAGYEAVQ